MSWRKKDEENLLKKAFFFGMGGIIACLLPFLNRQLLFTENEYIHLLTGIGIGVQLFALSIAVLVLRKPKISHETKSKGQRMVIALAFSLIFFFVM